VGSTPLDIADPGFAAILLEATPEAYARGIYGALRELDVENRSCIVVEGIASTGRGAAVMDRLRRAATEVLA
jgi:L-threonylcarbamoyladenylate synthase